ncbi:transposase [Priestia megaterium]|uniref:transposase n=1 Tax=Priestia megaterium TaxID=1404 RepID=UPI00399F2B77
MKGAVTSKEAVYITVGIHEDDLKEVIGYTIASNESLFVSKKFLEDNKSLGVEEILLFISNILHVI